LKESPKKQLASQVSAYMYFIEFLIPNQTNPAAAFQQVPARAILHNAIAG
jgi:hypothetical protein